MPPRRGESRSLGARTRGDAALRDAARLIHARYALADGLAAFEHAQRPGVLKVLLDMEDS